MTANIANPYTGAIPPLLTVSYLTTARPNSGDESARGSRYTLTLLLLATAVNAPAYIPLAFVALSQMIKGMLTNWGVVAVSVKRTKENPNFVARRPVGASVADPKALASATGPRTVPGSQPNAGNASGDNPG